MLLLEQILSFNSRHQTKRVTSSRGANINSSKLIIKLFSEKSQGVFIWMNNYGTQVVVLSWQSVAAMSLNIGGGVAFDKMAKLHMSRCAHKKQLTLEIMCRPCCLIKEQKIDKQQLIQISSSTV